MIQINDRLRIVKVDDRNLAIEEFRQVTSEKHGTREEWCWCGYYGTLKSALLGCLDKKMFDLPEADISSINLLLQKIEQCETEIIKAAKNAKI